MDNRKDRTPRGEIHRDSGTRPAVHGENRRPQGVNEGRKMPPRDPRAPQRRTPPPPQARPPKKKDGLLKKIKENMTPKRAMIIAVGIVVLAFAVCMLINILIGVRSIEVIGNDLASAEEIAEMAGITPGSGYFSYNTGASEKKVLENIHCIEDIQISRSIFGKVTVTVTEKKACWYMEVYGEYYALSEELTVIRHADLRDGFVKRGLVRLDFPEVKSVVLGKTVEYADGDRNCAFVPGFLSEVMGSELYRSGRIDQVKLETKFEIFVVCDMKYKINLGKNSGTAMKLSSVATAIANIDSDAPYEFNTSDVSNITAFENRELDFSYLAPTFEG